MGGWRDLTVKDKFKTGGSKMGESIKTGGVGKNPAIEKINRLNAVSSRVQAVSELEKRAFHAEDGRVKAALEKRKRIMEDFKMDFRGKQDGTDEE